MRWLLIALFLCAFTPIYLDHGDKKRTDDEFTNIYQQAQAKNFRVMPDTPSLNDIQEGEMVIVSTTSFTKIMFRRNQEIFAIGVSCVTVRR